MAPAEEVISNITLHICLLKKCRCDENPAIRGGNGYIMVKVGCGPRLWVVLLKISWEWTFHPKIPSYYVTNNPSSIPSCAPKIPLHVTLIPFQKWGIWDVTVGVFLLLVPIRRHRAGTHEKKNPSWWNDQFSIYVPMYYLLIHVPTRLLTHCTIHRFIDR